MIPVSLRLRNFLCYHEGLPPLEFGDLHVACLSGPNGAGKSALLDAITWALWGRARARSHDDLITVGAQEMEVEFEFLLEGNRYRVLRRRDRAARSGQGKSQLDLQVYGSQGWRSMAGESIRGTEQQIVDLLRMDYDTFINSAFLLQGRADEFTLKQPAERKQILADILGLGLYDELEQRAREQLRAEERQVQALSLVLEELQQELARREELEGALEMAEKAVAASGETVAGLQEQLIDLRARSADLEATARQAEELRRRLGQVDREIAQLEQRVAEQEARVEAARALLSRAGEIEQAHDHLQQVRERHEALSRAAGQLLALSERRRELEQALERARSALITEQEVLRRALAQMEERLQQRPAIEKRLADLHTELVSLREKEIEREALMEEANDKAAETRALKAERQRLRSEMEQLKEKLEMLQAGLAPAEGLTEGQADAVPGQTHCPLCRSPLGSEEIEHIRQSYQAEGREKRERHDECAGRIEELESRLRELRERQEALDHELRSVRTLERQQVALEKDQRELLDLVDEEAQKLEQRQAIEAILAEGRYAEEERAALARLEQEIADLAYDRSEHEALEQELARAAGAEEEFRQLQLTRERLTGEERQLDELRSSVQQRREEAAAEGKRLETLEAQIVELPAIAERCREAEAQLTQAQEVLGEARVSFGAAQGELERLQELAVSFEEKQQAHGESLDRRAIYEDLAAALGKRGVQAMLIETAVPEIEREANELLRRMTGGEMSLQLFMQRETKSGSVVETLDIHIYDVQGVRPYEVYSGGEKFRINFALRIALSRLLARRAGASLQTLVIDEGFGTQDTEGRERLVEAIHSIQDQFEKILVITHIQEMKELFPARIEVEKTPEGSRWIVL